MQSKDRKRRTSWNFIDLSGKEFGRLTVVSISDSRDTSGKPCWLCQCSCGETRVVSGSCLRRGMTKSCGCLMIERTKESNTKHGFKGTRVYRIWSGIKNRCYNPASKDYARYGGRGIVLCDRWMDFQNFLSDMGLPPTNKHSIERKINSLGYSLLNCEWATALEQAQNRRSSIYVTFQGKLYTASQLDRTLGFYPGTISKRLRNGKTEESGLFRPIQKCFSRSQKR